MRRDHGLLVRRGYDARQRQNEGQSEGDKNSHAQKIGRRNGGGNGIVRFIAGVRGFATPEAGFNKIELTFARRLWDGACRVAKGRGHG